MRTPMRRPANGSHGRQPGLRWISWSFVLVLVVSVAACAGREDRQDFFRGGPAEGPLWIEIQNDHFNDARIYVHWGGSRRRLGLVIGKTTEVFETEWRPQDLRIEVDLIAARGFVTDPLVVWPREAVFLQIPPR